MKANKSKPLSTKQILKANIILADFAMTEPLNRKLLYENNYHGSLHVMVVGLKLKRVLQILFTPICLCGVKASAKVGHWEFPTIFCKGMHICLQQHPSVNRRKCIQSW